MFSKCLLTVLSITFSGSSFQSIDEEQPYNVEDFDLSLLAGEWN
jgi:hypothetical protein